MQCTDRPEIVQPPAPLCGIDGEHAGVTQSARHPEWPRASRQATMAPWHAAPSGPGMQGGAVPQHGKTHHSAAEHVSAPHANGPPSEAGSASETLCAHAPPASTHPSDAESAAMGETSSPEVPSVVASAPWPPCSPVSASGRSPSAPLEPHPRIDPTKIHGKKQRMIPPARRDSPSSQELEAHFAFRRV
jgi:hypothetical protein